MKTLIRSATIEHAAKSGMRYPVTVSTTTPVTRGSYVEILDHSPGAIDLSRAPLPLIESHDRTRVNIGIVEGLASDGERLRGELVLGNSARARELAEDIDAGIVSNISIGYSVDEEREDGNIIFATRWTPHELSIVAVPADVRAGINRSITVADNTETATLAERTRARNIVEVCARAGIAEQADDFIERAVPIDEVRRAAFDAMASREVQHRPQMGEGRVGLDDFREAAIDTLLMRHGVSIPKPHPGAQDIRAMSAIEMARTCLTRGGTKITGFGPQKIIERALSTSDFPMILSGVVDKSLRRGFETEAGTHNLWVRRGSAKDFKPMTRVILGSAPDLDLVVEGGEYRYGTFVEDKSAFSVAKYGKIIKCTWELIVNDDLGALTRIPQAMGMAARRAEADLIYDLLSLNSGAGQTMQDGQPLFHASHNNTASLSTGVLDLVALNAARVKLRRQTAVGGGPLNLEPRFLIVSPEMEGQAETVVASTTRFSAGGAESSAAGWVSGLKVIAEPRLASNVAYLATSPDLVDTAEVATLDGHDAPELSQREGFHIDTIEWKVRHVFGTRFLDWRGIVKIS